MAQSREIRELLICLKSEVKTSKENSAWIKSTSTAIDELIKIDGKLHEIQDAISFAKEVVALPDELDSLRVAAKVTPEDTSKFAAFKKEFKNNHYQLAIAKYADYKSFVESFSPNLQKFEQLDKKISGLQAESQSLQKKQKNIRSAAESCAKTVTKFLKAISESSTFNSESIAIVKGYYESLQNILTRHSDKKFMSSEVDGLLLEAKRNVDLSLQIIIPGIEEFNTISAIRQKAIEQYAKQAAASTNPAATFSKSGVKEEQKPSVLPKEIKLK